MCFETIARAVKAGVREIDDNALEALVLSRHAVIAGLTAAFGDVWSDGSLYHLAFPGYEIVPGE
jgi:hypothetical protein